MNVAQCDRSDNGRTHTSRAISVSQHFSSRSRAVRITDGLSFHISCPESESHRVQRGWRMKRAREVDLWKSDRNQSWSPYHWAGFMSIAAVHKTCRISPSHLSSLSSLCSPRPVAPAQSYTSMGGGGEVTRLWICYVSIDLIIAHSAGFKTQLVNNLAMFD